MYQTLLAAGLRIRILTLMIKRTIEKKKLPNGLTFWYREPSSDKAVYAENGYYRFCTPTDKDVVMDIGANCGDMPLKWGLLAKEIHSYEPMPDTFGILKKNVEGNKLANCSIYEAAVGHGEGEIEIWANLDKNHTHATASTVTRRMRQSIKVAKMDFTSEVKRIKPTILKIDIEGGEREILDNAPDSVFKSCHTFLLEIHPHMWKDGKDWLEAVSQRMTSVFGEGENIGKVTFFHKLTGSVWKFSRK